MIRLCTHLVLSFHHSSVYFVRRQVNHVFYCFVMEFKFFASPQVHDLIPTCIQTLIIIGMI